MKKLAAVIAAALASATGLSDAAAPEVSGVTMEQGPNSRLVTIGYTLSADAVVTLDVQTNATANAETGWASIGGEAIWNAAGDVWKKVYAGSGTITWRPDLSWRDENGNGFKIGDGKARAVVTAWALDNPPDYMVVDITEGAAKNSQKYYPAVDFLPASQYGQKGAITNNPAYKTTSIVMRKIEAKDIAWTMGSAANDPGHQGNETEHRVTLDANYYIGVFEITQGQWGRVYSGSCRKTGYYTTDGTGRPMEIATYNILRLQNTFGDGNLPSNRDPEYPVESSFLGQLYVRTGIHFDLPSEAQWEFAARAGHDAAHWGDGTPILSSVEDANLLAQSRCPGNSGDYIANGQATGTDAGTAIVGSYAPNSWGLYDVHGNALEWCRDGYNADITSNTTGAARPNVQNNIRVLRGGGYALEWGWLKIRPTFRTGVSANEPESVSTYTRHCGVRVMCPAEID